MTTPAAATDQVWEARLWRCVPGDALSEWESQGQVVVYDNRSGDTHLLDALGAQLLRRLREQPSAADGLTRRLALETGETADASAPAPAPAPGSRDAVRRWLVRLHELSLIEPLP